MNLVVGKKSGTRYHLAPSALVGQGVEGRVYRFGETCVKVLNGPVTAERSGVVRALSALAPKIPGFAWPIEAVVDPAKGEEAGFSMPFVPGESLESLLDARATGSIPPEVKIRLALGAARAVAEAHAHRGPAVVLGDVIKAGNLIIDGDRATFVDAASASVFGFRVASGAVVDSCSPLTTPGYVPREVLENPGALPSEATDRFALAVLLFELFTGRGPHEVRPCPASVGLEPDDSVRRGIYPRWARHPDFDAPGYDPVDFPPEVDQLFRAAFLASAVRPSALEWCQALEEWREDVAPAWRRLRRRAPRWLRRVDPFSVAVVVLVALAYAARWAWDYSTADRPPPPAPGREVGPPSFRDLFR